jgi:hypothetical protein
MAKLPTSPTLYDEAKRISISSLKQWGYLEGCSYKQGTITWSRGDTQTGSIQIAVNMLGANPYLELSYSINDGPVNYRVPLVQVPSNLGKGSVWYFLCPHTEKRCRILYLVGTRFLHREAVRGAMYERQTYSKKWRGFKTVLDAMDFDEVLSQRHFRTHYKDKPTKRFKRLLERQERRSALVLEGGLRRLLLL